MIDTLISLIFNPITIFLVVGVVGWQLLKAFAVRGLDVEHGIFCYYGRLGQGKTYALVRDTLSALNAGAVVYSNFTINWDGYDERKNPFAVFLAGIGLKKKFISFPKSNLRQMPTDENWHREFGKLRNCIVVIDEAYVLFDSYQMSKMPMSQRLNILQTRKFDRSIWYTTQRPTSVHAVMRGMTNVFYRCEKWNVPFMTLFARDEFDLASDETVDIENRLSRKLYRGESKYFNMYNTKETVGIMGELSNIGQSVEKEETYEIHIVRPWHVWGALAPRRASKAQNEPSRAVPLRDVLPLKQPKQ